MAETQSIPSPALPLTAGRFAGNAVRWRRSPPHPALSP